MLILHVTEKSAWEKALEEGAYLGESLTTEGFIHCCVPQQLEGVLRDWFVGKNNLVLLEIDPRKLISLLKYESVPGKQEEYPHIYGSLNLDAVEKVRRIENS